MLTRPNCLSSPTAKGIITSQLVNRVSRKLKAKLPLQTRRLAAMYAADCLLTAWAIWGTAAYVAIIAFFGIGLNIFILKKIRMHLNMLSSNELTEKGSKSRARTIVALIIVLLLLDLLGILAFVASNLVSDDAPVDEVAQSFAFQQLAFAIVSMHLCSEAALFQMIVQYFRRSSTGSSGRDRTGSSPRTQTGGAFPVIPPRSEAADRETRSPIYPPQRRSPDGQRESPREKNYF
ncbi:hypothetical protein HK105_200395 [Polyrhizophydium stewartii]|uniref:Uncharacterized protein n=1 Tax=Polyrhizophydium stewartii TaxID=2732419 RepID=A0ABR4NLD4_9FUNG